MDCNMLRDKICKEMLKNPPEQELKPCPFCGSPAKEISPYNRPSEAKYWVIQCQGCSARVRGTHRRMNQENWNRRTEVEVISDENKDNGD